MYASIPHNPASSSELFRWFARASSAVLFMIWIVLLVQELMGEFHVTRQGIVQAISLTIVFVGYAFALRRELAGALIAVFGTIMFFTACAVTTGELPGLAAAWFAFPAVLYLLAWHYDKRCPNIPMRSP